MLAAAVLPSTDPSRRAQLQAGRAHILGARQLAGDTAVSPGSVVAAWRETLEGLDRGRDPSLWASLQNNLGNACNNPDRPLLERCAREAYAAALSVRTAGAMPREHFDTLTNLALLEFRLGNWDKAASLSLALTKQSQAMFGDASGAGFATDAAARATRAFEEGAFALAKLGRVDEAYRLLDEGRARSARTRLGLGASSPRVPVPADIIIVAPLVTNQGVAVLAKFEGGIHATFFDDLKGPEVASRITSPDPTTPGWLQMYEAAQDVDRAPEGARRRRWIGDVAAMADWLGDRLVQPTLDWLARENAPPGQPIVWSVQGELAVLPFASATLRDGEPLVARRPIAFTPAEAFVGAPRAAPTGPVISFANPTDDPNLALAQVESASVLMLTGTARAKAAPPPATRAIVLDAISNARIFHFAGHAWHDPDVPEDSFLETADGPLRLRDLLSARPARAPMLVILSACESGRIRITDAANEFQGLPIGFLGAGTGGVIATLWPVEDLVALLIVDGTIREMTRTRLPPAQALAAAQNWLRTATGPVLAERLRAIALVNPAPKLDEAAAILSRLDAAAPFAPAAYWGSFIYAGEIKNTGEPK